MILEPVFRFLVGGVVVSLFALLEGVLKPKSFAGLLSAAPSVALAKITLTVAKKGRAGVQQGRSFLIIEAVWDRH